MLYSLPFAVQPLQHAFEAVGRAAAGSGRHPARRPAGQLLPRGAAAGARRASCTAAVLSFAHTVGEFGVVLMIGGNIPEQTRVVSTQIYDHVEALEYAQAHWLAGGMLVFSFAVLLALALLNRRSTRVLG